MSNTTVEERIRREKIALKLLARAKGVTSAELAEACEIGAASAARVLSSIEVRGYARRCGSHRWNVYAATTAGAEKAYASREPERIEAMRLSNENRIGVLDRIPGSMDLIKKSKPKKATEGDAPKKRKKPKTKDAPKKAPKSDPCVVLGQTES